MNVDKIPVEELVKPDFSIGETNYTIHKFSSMEGYTLFERIRVAVGNSEIVIDGNLDDKAILGWIKAILTLDLNFVEFLRLKLFEEIEFTNASAQTPQKLAGAEDMAIEEPLQFYEIMFRSLAVNFTPSFQDILSRLTGPSSPKQTTKRKKGSKTQT